MLPLGSRHCERKLGAIPSVARTPLTLQAAMPNNEDAASTASLETSILDFSEIESRRFFAGSCEHILGAL